MRTFDYTCIKCGKPYPTIEFRGKSGACIMCEKLSDAQEQKAKADALKKPLSKKEARALVKVLITQ